MNGLCVRAAGAEEIVRPRRLVGASGPPLNLTVRGHVSLRLAQEYAFAMAASRDEILRKALTLPERDRADLVGALIDSLDAEAEEGVEDAWRSETECRAKELDSGDVQSIPWEVVKARLSRAPRG